MKIALTVGHSLLKNGSYTSADGKKYGGCNEYKWCKAFSRQVAAALKKNGHQVTRIVCPEKTFASSMEERAYKLHLIHREAYDLVIELHLNAAAQTASGTEVLYKSAAGKIYAASIQGELATVFRDRGVKQRTDLYMLNQTKPPAVLIETFFCTSKSDYKLAKGIKKRARLAKLIARGVENAVRERTIS